MGYLAFILIAAFVVASQTNQSGKESWTPTQNVLMASQQWSVSLQPSVHMPPQVSSFLASFDLRLDDTSDIDLHHHSLLFNVGIDKWRWRQWWWTWSWNDDTCIWGCKVKTKYFKCHLYHAKSQCSLWWHGEVKYSFRRVMLGPWWRTDLHTWRWTGHNHQQNKSRQIN